jgi:hypothetical protein
MVGAARAVHLTPDNTADRMDAMPRRARSKDEVFRNTKLPWSETKPTGVQCFNKNILSEVVARVSVLSVQWHLV